MSSSDEDDGPQTPEKEALNLSNDQYYQPVAGFNSTLGVINEKSLSIPKYDSPTIQHSLPAYDLWLPFFPTYIGEEKFRNFHRPKLRHYNTGPQSRRSRRLKSFPIKSLTRTICRFQIKLRSKIITAINNGLSRKEIVDQFLLIRNASDLTAKKGELFLFEYCEEFPPVLSQIGMAANVKTLIVTDGINKNASSAVKALPKQRLNRESSFMKSTAISLSSQNLKATDDGDKSPTKAHSVNRVDNLQTNVQLGNYKTGFDETVSDPTSNSINKPHIYYRKLQPGERMRVIENNMYRAPIFEHEMPSCDFLVIRTRNSFYIRGIKTIFTVGQTMPLVAVPEPTESAISRFRTDLSNRYIHKLFMESGTAPPSISLERLMELFPDYSRDALRIRLKKNGVTNGEKVSSERIYKQGHSKYGLETLLDHRYAFKPERYCLNMAMLAARQRLRELNYTESMINPPNDAEMELEVLAAPWNTSKAVMRAFANRDYLDFKRHLIDPTGSQKEGFSCVSWVKSPTEAEQQKTMQQNSNLTGQQRNACSTAPNLQNPLSHKIRREKLERLAIYQSEANRISEVQANVLSSKEVLSSDEDEDESDKADEENLLGASFDEELHDLDRMIIGGRTVDELNFEKEEEERRQMLEDLSENEKLKENGFGSQFKRNNLPQVNVGSFENRILKITRTYNSPQGKIERTEVVREPKIIALYIKQKGGSLQASQDDRNGAESNGDNSIEVDHCPSLSLRLKSVLNRSINSSQFSSDSHHLLKKSQRRQSLSLGPTELCRAEGLRLTISKKVLNSRELRRRQRELSTSAANI